MGAPGGLGVEVAEAFLDPEPGNGIRIVGSPDLGAEAEHTQIEPVAAGGAAFQQQPGPGLEDPPQNIVKTQNMVMGALAHRHRVPVHIPLDVGNPAGIQNLGHIFHDIVPDLRFSQIQQQLMPSGDGGEAVGQRPIRMGPVKVRILVDALRLEPEAKLHSQLLDFGGKARHALGQFLGIHIVIAQTRLIVVSGTEPAVIQYEKLHAQLFCSACQPYQLSVGELKKMRFPVVGEDGALLALPLAADDVIIDKAVEIFPQAVEAV